MMLTTTMILVIVLLMCVPLAWYGRSTGKDEPPALSGALPLIGHAHLLIGDSSKLWHTFKKVCYESLNAGGVITTFLGPRPVYFVTDPNDFLKIANTCLEKDPLYGFTKPFVGNGLATSDASVWRVHRKRMNPAFSQVVLDGYQDVFNAQSRRLVKDLEVEVGKGMFNHWVYTRHNALETICLTALGVDFKDKKVLFTEYVNALEDILDVFLKRFQRVWLHVQFIFNCSQLKRKQEECLKILHNMSNTVLKHRKTYYLDNRKCKEIDDPKVKGPIFKPLMDLLLELGTENGCFNDQEIKDHVDTMVFAGHDTTSSVLMYTLLLVGSYPNVQDEIFKELYRVFGDEDRDVTKQDLSQLVYLEAVLKESMRFYPSAPYVIRYLDSDVKLRNCTLSKGRTCFLSIYGVHRHPMWGPDAEEFKPERWLDPAAFRDSTIPFAAFSIGKRNCIAPSFAYASMKTTLAHLFRHYKVTADHTKLVVKVDILLKPVSGHHIAIDKRKI